MAFWDSVKSALGFQPAAQGQNRPPNISDIFGNGMAPTPQWFATAPPVANSGGQATQVYQPVQPSVIAQNGLTYSVPVSPAPASGMASNGILAVPNGTGFHPVTGAQISYNWSAPNGMGQNT